KEGRPVGSGPTETRRQAPYRRQRPGPGGAAGGSGGKRGAMRLGTLSLVLLCTAVGGVAFAQSPEPGTIPLEPITAKWTGDLDGMIERRMIRVLVPYSKTYYFVDKGDQYGVAYEMGRKFEEELNARLKTGHLKVQVVFVPVSRDQILP